MTQVFDLSPLAATVMTCDVADTTADVQANRYGVSSPCAAIKVTCDLADTKADMEAVGYGYATLNSKP